MKKDNKLMVKLGLCCMAAMFLAFIPRDEDPLGKLVTSLQRWTDSIPQEKIYLHTDKPYYVLGDTIWFKGYLTIGSKHQLSALSGAMYVDLINQNDSLIQQLKLPVTSGMVIGNFILKDEYPQGNYRLRAYTQWMRNAGEEYFYDHTFLVGDVGGGNVIAKANFKYKTANGKPKLTAILNYSNDAGSTLGNRDVRYEIRRRSKFLWQQNATTDAAGNLAFNIPDDAQKDPAGVYIRTILKDGKNTIVREFPLAAAQSQSDVQFFPESGNLVSGLASHVAFKAIGVDGLGINIKGTVTDNDNNQVAKIETLHLGMGSFLFTPQAGKTYNANITFDDGSTKTIALQKPADQGYVLGVYQPGKDSLLVRIQASASLQQTTVNLIAHTNGDIVLSSPIKIASPITSVWVDKKLFRSGIAQFTLFDNAGQPLNERLAFIRNNDQLSLDIKTAKTTYVSKEHVLVDLSAKDSKGQPTFGNFSVSVIDEKKVPFDENKASTIFSNLLLTADLKGYVEEPNYYFANEGEAVDHALDNLMLTQGYRRFTWKELNNIISTKPKYPVEGLGISISGTVTTLTKRILPNAKVELISLRAKVAKSTTTDANGRFSFDGIFMTDSIKFAVQARMGTSDHTILTLDTLPKIRINHNINLPDVSTNIPGSLKSYLANAKNEDDVYEKLGLLDKVHRLREVNIRAKKLAAQPSDIKPQGMFRIPEASADQVVNVDPEEAKNYVSLAQYLEARIQGVRIVRGALTHFESLIPGDGPLKLYVDGRWISSADEVSDILESEYAPEDVAKVEVVVTNQAMINFLGSKGILILTRLGSTRKIYNPSTANISPKGFNKVREFYAPRYDRRDANLDQPDTRSTIYWNPYLKTDAAGKTSFSYFNADGPGTYKVIVEGINADGQLGRKVYHYTVDGSKTALAPNASAVTPAAAPVKVENSPAAAAVKDFNKRMPAEKVYLHFDRPYYNLNDTLWFKAYLVNSQDLTPSQTSKMLYVEFDDDSVSAVRRVSIRLKDGVGWGQIPLPTNVFHEGAYTLRAYTNWMQNFGAQSFFSKRLYLGKANRNSWLINANGNLSKAGNKDVLNLDIKLNKPDKLLSPVALKSVEVTLYEIKDTTYKFQGWFYREKLQTGIDGSLKISTKLDKKLNTGRVRMSIKSLAKEDDGRTIQTPVSINRSQNIDLQFMPEGGQLVIGLKSTVGFKAIGEDGMSAVVSGDVYTATGTKVLSFNTEHDGMGSFEFTPAAGQVYTAKLSSPVEKVYKLPLIQPNGTVMHLDNAEQSENIKVNLTGLNSLGTDTACYLTGLSKGVVLYSHLIQAGETEFSLAKNIFPTGIVHVVLFKGLRPVNERLTFVDHKDAFNISITPDKTGYGTRDSVGLAITVTDKSGIPVQGSFSLAVTDDSQVVPDSLDNFGINAGLLLNAELKGRVESPGYYINRKTPQAWQDLDNLLLTQGWTGYDWKNIFAPAKAPGFVAEKDFKIAGRVTGLTNKPAASTPVILSSQKPQFLLTTFTDADGKFEFNNLPAIDSGSFFIQANNAKGKKMISADLGLIKFKPPYVPVTDTDPILPWYTNSNDTQLNAAKHIIEKQPDNFKAAGTLLREVNIKDKKIIKGAWYTGGTNLTLDDEDIKKSTQPNLYDLLRQKIPGFKIINDWRAKQRRGLVTIKIGDDDFIDAFFIDGANLLDVRGIPDPDALKVDDPKSAEEYIEAMRDFKVAGLQGVQVVLSRSFPLMPKEWNYGIIYITTKQGLGGALFRNKPGTDTYRPMPVLEPQQFYSPKYTTVSNTDQTDYRPTLFWKPDITTDANGKAKVSFYTSDIKGKYTVKFAGMDNQGGLGDGTIKLNASGANKSSQSKPAESAPVKKAAIKVPATGQGIQLITGPLDSLNKRMPAEKVYLHTDKPYYNIGDTLWFKSYLLDRGDLTPSHMSGLLYVELINDTSQVVRRVSLPVKDGICWGQIPLPHKIFREGGYTIRAYTNWMQNFDEQYLFTQRFYLGVSSTDNWLINTHAVLNRINDKDHLDIDLKLSRPDKRLSPIALRKMEVKLFDEWHYVYKKNMLTGIDGSLHFDQELKEKADATQVRVQLTSLEASDKNRAIQVPLIVNRDQNIDLQFMPEGGKLVTGFKSIVGFKALSENGRGITVAGAVFDSQGKQVASLTSLHNGMGAFEFTPARNETYTAKLTKPVTKNFILPKPDTAGTVMHIVNNETDDDLKITLSGAKSLPADSGYFLLGTSRGLICYAQKVEEDNFTLSAPKKLFPSGIARFTFFFGKRPLNERAVFIDHHDQLKFNIVADRSTYNKRDSVALKIEVKDKDGFPVQGNFSLAVDDDSQARPDTLGNNNILTSLLLNSELKGNVESPGYYINRKDPNAWRALDNLLLTQGWTDYDWNYVFAGKKKPAYKLEKDIAVTGRVVNIVNKPIANAQVNILLQKPDYYAIAITDSAGRYAFKDLPKTDSAAFFIQLSNNKGKKKWFGDVSVDEFTPAPTPETSKNRMLPWYVNADTTQIEHIKQQLDQKDREDLELTGNVLKAVTIKDKKIIPDSDNPFGPGNSDLAFDERDIRESGIMDLYELLQQKLAGFTVINDWKYSGGKVMLKWDKMLLPPNTIIIDGKTLPLHIDDPLSVPEYINELKKIKIYGLKGFEAIWTEKYLKHIYPPAIVLTTISGRGWYQIAKTATARYRPIPLLYPQRFYSPKYTAKSPVADPDYRSTLCWEPSLTTNQSGEAKVSFYTSDVKSSYTVKIAGIDGNGKIGDGSVVINRQ